MNARQAQLRMLEVEMHDQDFSVGEFLTWLLHLEGDHADQIADVLQEEINRGAVLAENHYARVTRNVTVIEPRAILAIGFQQGATFAAAALGRKSWREEHHDEAS